MPLFWYSGSTRICTSYMPGASHHSGSRYIAVATIFPSSSAMMRWQKCLSLRVLFEYRMPSTEVGSSGRIAFHIATEAS